MVKKIRVRDLDCADCAAKLERSLGKLDGVRSASVDFIMQKITLDIDDGAADSVLAAVVKTCKKVEPDMALIGV